MTATAARLNSHLRIATRGEVYAGAATLLLANGLVLRVARSIRDQGFADAILATFEISVLVWVAILAAVALLLRDRSPLRGYDMAVAVTALAACALPSAQLAWLGLTAIGALLLLRGAGDLRRAALILLALAAAMFWGRLLLQLGGDSLLALDARLVGLLTGRPSEGNLVRLAGESGWLWIAPYCSSLTNVSLAFLCCVLVVAWRGLPWSRAQSARCLLAAIAVVLINDGRMALIVLVPDRYEMIHGPAGSAVASWITLAAILLIALWRQPATGAANG